VVQDSIQTISTPMPSLPQPCLTCGQLSTKVKPFTGDLTAMYCSGDTQWGKDAGDGTAGTVARVRHGIQESVARHKELKNRGVGQIALPQLGDCIEGTVSQHGRIVGRLDLSLTEQIRVGRRILLEWVKAFAPLTESLIIPTVPGNAYWGLVREWVVAS